MKLFLIRGINFLKILSSYFLSLLTPRVIHRGFPAAVSLEPTNTCNLRCPECPAGMKELSRSAGFMDPSLYRAVVEQLMPHLSWITLYFQGEPFLHPGFFEFISFARHRKIFVAASTNGHFLDEGNVQKILGSGLDKLIISVDGPDQESYETYRKQGDFARVINGIRLLMQERDRMHLRKPRVILQCLLLKSNERRLGEMKRLARDLKVDKIEFKTAQFNDFERGDLLMPDNPRLSRYHPSQNRETSPPTPLPGERGEIRTSAHPHIRTSANYSINNPLRNRCFRMWSSCVITWDGKVVPCCYDKDARHELGDLRRQSFREIWKGEAAGNFRKTIFRNRQSVEICRNCNQRF